MTAPEAPLGMIPEAAGQAAIGPVRMAEVAGVVETVAVTGVVAEATGVVVEMVVAGKCIQEL